MTMAISGFPRRAGSTSARLALGMLVFLAYLGAGPAGAASDDENFFTHLHTDKAMANVTVSPGRAGPVEIMIQLETMDERPLTAKAVSVTLFNTPTGVRLPAIQAD